MPTTGTRVGLLEIMGFAVTGGVGLVVGLDVVVVGFVVGLVVGLDVVGLVVVGDWRSR